MRFSIEQTFLTDSCGKPLRERPAEAYHIVEAETLDAALSLFLVDQQASLVGNIQRLPGAYVVATAQQQGTVFTIHVAAGSDWFRRERREGPDKASGGPADTPRDSARPR